MRGVKKCPMYRYTDAVTRLEKNVGFLEKFLGFDRGFRF